MSELITPAGILRLVEAIPETADNFPIQQTRTPNE